MASPEKPRDFEVQKSIDCRGKRCPVPIYMATRALASMEAGDVLEVKTTDAASVNDFPDFAARAGHDMLAIEQEEDKVHVFFVRKGNG